MAELYPRLDNNPNLLPITTTATIHKPGHRRNGSSITVTSIKAVTMKGNVVENLLINLGVRTNTPEETTKRNYRTLLSMMHFVFYKSSRFLLKIKSVHQFISVNLVSMWWNQFLVERTRNSIYCDTSWCFTIDTLTYLCIIYCKLVLCIYIRQTWKQLFIVWTLTLHDPLYTTQYNIHWRDANVL